MSKIIFKSITFLIIFIIFLLVCKENHSQTETKLTPISTINLPAPTDNGIKLMEAIKLRQSNRDLNPDGNISLNELSNILYAAQGITHDSLRSCPSAGALYPIDLYLIINNVSGLEKGLYIFNVKDFKLGLLKKNDFSKQMLDVSSFKQNMVKDCSVLIVMVCTWEKITQKYGNDGINYSYLEAGHIAQNVGLMVASLKLKSTPVGAFNSNGFNSILGIDGKKQTPIYLLPVGR